MKNIILQHWSGEMTELTKLSSANISRYAKKLGCDYELLRGNVFCENLNPHWPPVQKLHMLDEKFDGYDMVVMLDADMFTRKGMDKNIFTDTTGVGWHGPMQDILVRQCMRTIKESNSSCSYWGGSIYRLDRELRQTLRQHLSKISVQRFCSREYHGDEGIMHVLASYAGVRGRYLPTLEWNYPSFELNIKQSSIIHMRTKIGPQGPKRTKLENYKNLVRLGIIESN